MNRASSGLEPSPPLHRPAVVLDALPGVGTGMVDRAGRALVLGSAVLVRGGEHAGRAAEVVGWGGRRGVEVVVCGAPPAFLALPPALLDLVDVALLDPIVPRRRRPCCRSAPAGGARQAADRAAREPEADGAIPSGAGSRSAARRHHQNPGLRRLARPEGGLQAGVPQAPQVAPER
jgi:hypothetical protein